MVAVIVDAVAVFASLQNPDSGVLDFSLISNTNFTLVGIVSAIGIVLCVVCNHCKGYFKFCQKVN